jgi:hypothetical protein
MVNIELDGHASRVHGRTSLSTFTGRRPRLRPSTRPIRRVVSWPPRREPDLSGTEPNLSRMVPPYFRVNDPFVPPY